MEAIGDNISTPAANINQPDAGLIKDSSAASFVRDVIEASKTRPVLVDFWAPWCGPCKQLTPTLEKAVTDAGGVVALVKINVDDNQQIAQQLRIQSIPAVFAFKDGQPVDGFVGNQPESQIRALIERLAGPIGTTNLEKLLEAGAEAFHNSDVAAAAQCYGQALQMEQGHPEAIAGLAKCYVATGDFEHARQVLALAPPKVQDNAEIAAVRAALALAEKSQSIGDVGPLLQAVETNPADHQARCDLAVALAAKGESEGAITHLLASIKKDRNWNDAAARKQLLSLFELLGPDDEVTIDGRRRLSAILFS